MCRDYKTECVIKLLSYCIGNDRKFSLPKNVAAWIETIRDKKNLTSNIWLNCEEGI